MTWLGTAMMSSRMLPRRSQRVARLRSASGSSALVARRNNTYFRNNADFLSQLAKGVTVPEQDIRVSSDYFLATLRVTSGGAQARGKALFARLEAARWPVVVWHKSQ